MVALCFPGQEQLTVRLGVRNRIDLMISEVENQSDQLERKEGKLELKSLFSFLSYEKTNVDLSTPQILFLHEQKHKNSSWGVVLVS